MRNPTSNMANCLYGDQEFIYPIVKRSMDYVQDLYPNREVSYKKHCFSKQNGINIPEDASIVCFHGNPRPHKVDSPIIHKHWRG